ncbi:nucleotide-diphospho-sugar transferase [Aspergillus caelatus]|uniref:Nucleotide-diphospho-sugar transferase n=2 Tax=Aspergillus subgen. Circumdati TaxID=2720871 RepID=A0A5N6ZV33_9EURO|nr:nucleotide-diphospho-sugar transferase [Aspergillus caelatus]KAE8361265.1 nucleotide-diphospho-sugar transferase [Aspergillus caelatus]KAE8420224.1 nucleotide-diphospho-sugar transferase [Aspergillus pseudocaelatus]
MSALQPLLLAGGRSSRMGRRKELLPLVHDIPIYMNLLRILDLACPHSHIVYLSLRSPDCLRDILNDPRVTELSPGKLAIEVDGSSTLVQVIYDRASDSSLNTEDDIGPAGGLLAAHRFDPQATWQVVACDYPFLSVSDLHHLQQEMAGPVTCFQNADGICEPLLGIWTPEAMHVLDQNVRKGICGPKSVIRQCSGKTIRPRDDRCLFNMNTPADLDTVLTWIRC